MSAVDSRGSTASRSARAPMACRTASALPLLAATSSAALAASSLSSSSSESHRLGGMARREHPVIGMT
eukprot:2751223-Prymnesium_polylepis.1